MVIGDAARQLGILLFRAQFPGLTAVLVAKGIVVGLQRINYSELNARQKEIYNFQKLAAILADYGFNCIKMSDDWQGADFLADHMNGGQTLRVQLKARLTISRKYEGRNLYVGFPAAGNWYLAPHDELVDFVGKTTKWLKQNPG